MLNDMGMKCLLKNFSKMALILIPQHNVYQIHIKQVLLMIVLMVFEERGEEYDVLIIILKLCGIVLLQHRIQGNVMQYEIYIYYVHAVMHEQQLKYELKLLKKEKKENNDCNDSNSNDNNNSKQDDNFETVLLVLTPQHNVHEPHMIHVLLMINLMVLTEKGGKYDLFMVVMINLFGIAPLQHKTRRNSII